VEKDNYKLAITNIIQENYKKENHKEKDFFYSIVEINSKKQNCLLDDFSAR